LYTRFMKHESDLSQAEAFFGRKMTAEEVAAKIAEMNMKLKEDNERALEIIRKMEVSERRGRARVHEMRLD
jgi:hypothetical protein